MLSVLRFYTAWADCRRPSEAVRSYEGPYFIRKSSGLLPLATAAAIHLG